MSFERLYKLEMSSPTWNLVRTSNPAKEGPDLARTYNQWQELARRLLDQARTDERSAKELFDLIRPIRVEMEERAREEDENA